MDISDFIKLYKLLEITKWINKSGKYYFRQKSHPNYYRCRTDNN